MFFKFHTLIRIFSYPRKKLMSSIMNHFSGAPGKSKLNCATRSNCNKFKYKRKIRTVQLFPACTRSHKLSIL